MNNEFTSAHFPSSIRDLKPKIGLVLGSGLAGFVDRIRVTASVEFGEIPGLPTSRVPGHDGRFVFGSIGDIDVVVAQGRVHLYEGWSAREVAAGVRAMAALGVGKLILTNAAGIINHDFHPGQWMQIVDHLNLTGQSPLTGGPHFVDQSRVYSRSLRQIFRDQADRLGIPLAEGVYAWVPGPQYETPAEIRMLRTLGADAVGMSTVPEAIQARAMGIEVAGFSCLTNYGAGITADPLSHEEVLETGRQAADMLARLLEASFLG
ncbi:MAG: purine-nucleoside phosphorylase [Verrucomicrobiae bacterium]|nr:purine-nucleoside phosphorylase [Verrucomicrobiae bacterium]MCB1092368.1 purine-nucleoside phosphorylase [Verrucomicrobiae bacterium]